MSPRKRLAVLLALAAAVAGATGCGSNEIKGQLTPDQASALVADLDAVQSAAEAGQCGSAAAGADRFVVEVNSLPAEAGTELKDALRDAGTNLKTLAACEPSGTTGATGPKPDSTSGETTSSTTSTPTTTTDSTTTTTTSEPEPSPTGGGNGNAGGNGNTGGNGQGNGNPGTGNAGGGGSSGGTGGGTGGTGVGGD